jgi:hypothetical protein
VAADAEQPGGKHYRITRAGTRALGKETERWRRLAGLVEKLLAGAP